MHKRAALVGPSIVVLGRGDIRENGHQVRRLRHRREHLSRAHVRAAEHAHLAVGVVKRSSPFDRVVSVLTLVTEGIELAAGIKTATGVLQHDDIAARSQEGAGRSVAPVVRCALEQDRKLAGSRGAIDICHQCDPVAHPDRYAGLHMDLIFFAEAGRRARDDEGAEESQYSRDPRHDCTRHRFFCRPHPNTSSEVRTFVHRSRLQIRSGSEAGPRETVKNCISTP